MQKFLFEKISGDLSGVIGHAEDEEILNQGEMKK